ncbi:hypothetical protein HN935_01355 [archaeon]|jgi:hypothetical protein|nr:hypothetical protein [archaeon]
MENPEDTFHQNYQTPRLIFPQESIITREEVQKEWNEATRYILKKIK